jgi:hypothetical protein
LENLKLNEQRYINAAKQSQDEINRLTQKLHKLDAMCNEETINAKRKLQDYKSRRDESEAGAEELSEQLTQSQIQNAILHRELKNLNVEHQQLRDTVTKINAENEKLQRQKGSPPMDDCGAPRQIHELEHTHSDERVRAVRPPRTAERGPPPLLAGEGEGDGGSRPSPEEARGLHTTGVGGHSVRDVCATPSPVPQGGTHIRGGKQHLPPPLTGQKKHRWCTTVAG